MAAEDRAALGAWGLLALNCFSLVFEVEEDGVARRTARHPRTGGRFGPRRLAACTASWLIPAMASSEGCCDDEMNEEWNTALRIEDDTDRDNKVMLLILSGHTYRPPTNKSILESICRSGLVGMLSKSAR